MKTQISIAKTTHPNTMATRLRTTCATRVLPMLLLLLLTLPAAVQAQFNYTTNNGTITITGYTGPGGAVSIPSSILVDGVNLPVTSIGEGAFGVCTSLTSVTIPNSVTSIGNAAFSTCTNLASVTIPDSVTNIGSGALNTCSSLSSVTIPNGVTSIGSYAFQFCTSLTSVTIGIGVTSIGHEAFDQCTSLTSVTIPNSVTNIGSGAFLLCYGLTAITVDAPNAFYSSVDGVLFNKSTNTLIQCPGGKAGSYTVPNSVTIIGNFAFDTCMSLTSVTIPNSVTSIGTYAFLSCTSLTNVTIGNSVTNIGSAAFYFCTSLANVMIPNSVTSIGDWAYSYCTSLTGVYFHGNAPSLGGSSVFSGDNNATVYYLPGTTGWNQWVSPPPAVLWNPQVQISDASFGVQTNQFGFNINWASGMTVVVEACTDVANPIWSPLQTNILTGGSSYFSDSQWTNYPARFYRLRWP